MTNEEKRPMSTAEKHEQARAFALSGTLSKFQLAKQRKALESKLLAEKNLPVKVSRPNAKHTKQHYASYQSTTAAATTATPTAIPSSSASAVAAPLLMSAMPIPIPTSISTSMSGAHNISAPPPPLVVAPQLLSASATISSGEEASPETTSNAILQAVESAPPLVEPTNPNASSSMAAASTSSLTATSTQPNNLQPSSSSAAIFGEDPKTTWEMVDYRDWQYVYICAGEFEGKFGYYDDHNQEANMALIYFGMPMVGDGPYQMPLEDLRKPPPQYCDNAFTAM